MNSEELKEAVEEKTNNWPSLLLFVFLVVTWVPGVVLAKGFWSTFAATFIPPWAWYLLAEKLMEMSGII